MRTRFCSGPIAVASPVDRPGMNANAFLFRADRGGQPRGSEWRAAILKTLAGITLTWIVARTALPNHPLLAGWLGMVGLILVLHFGTFHLLSLGWRKRGVDASPVMRNPMASSSLSEFWGRRWNTAFHELATQFAFRPAQLIVGRTTATLLVFLVSGFIHELVISVPAHGGYGLPTGYFVLQGLGVAAERTRWERRSRMRLVCTMCTETSGSGMRRCLRTSQPDPRSESLAAVTRPTPPGRAR